MSRFMLEVFAMNILGKNIEFSQKWKTTHNVIANPHDFLSLVKHKKEQTKI